MGEPVASQTSVPPPRTKKFDIQIPLDQMDPVVNRLISILEQSKLFAGLTRSSRSDGVDLQYRLLSMNGNHLDVAVKFYTNRVEVQYFPYPPNSVSEKDFISMDLELEAIIRSYFSDQRKASLFLVFSEKMKLIPQTTENRVRKIVGSIVLGNFFWIFILFMTVGLFLFQFFGMYTPLLLIILSFVFVLFAGRFLRFRGEFDITAENPSIYIAELRMKRSEFDQVMKACIPKINEVKKRIYEATLGRGSPLDEKTIVATLNEYGAPCAPEYVRVKGVDIYKLVKDLGSTFGITNPSVTLLNILAPNAAATGISPKHATVMVTSGLIATMNEEEIKSVLAHEFSHVKAHDPLFLLTLASVEYLLRVYVVLPILPGGLFVQIAYILFAFTVIFFIAKFLEARADLDAAKYTNSPKVLASSLRKLGLFKYQSHAFEIVNAGEWINWDTHPPLYYRIRTLENLDPSWLRHTFLSAIKGCIKGFISALKGK
jgi:heat shock protein HtpX